jgi:hypothetical protein
MVKNNKELLERIHSFYGDSKGWLSELAGELQISRHGASCLAREAGYYRHKLVKQVSLATFTSSPYAKFIIKKKGLGII